MGRRDYVVHFLLVVTPLPPLMIPAFIACVSAAGVLIPLSPSHAAAALTPILLLQLFACSSGFDVPARRGHYDLLLTTGERRSRIAVAHWVASMAPGLAAWGSVVIIETLFRFGTPPSTASTGSAAAVLLVSTIPWAVTIRLPRFAAAVGWLMLLAILAFAMPALLHGAIDEAPQWRDYGNAALAVALYPPVLVGRSLAGSWGVAALPAIVLAGGAMAVAIVSIDRRDIPLEAAQ